MENSFYNTNNETGSTLEKSEAKAVKQEDAILDIYIKVKKLSASEVWNRYGKEQFIPITSIRRGITNLCNSGHLQKTDDTVTGIYGKQEHIYRYAVATESKQLELF